MSAACSALEGMPPIHQHGAGCGRGAGRLRGAVSRGAVAVQGCQGAVLHPKAAA